MTLDQALIAAVATLSGVIGLLWRLWMSERTKAQIDQREATRLIFALLGERAMRRGEKPPPTASTVESPQFPEAAKLANEALSDDVETLLKAYLESDPPPKKRWP